LHSPHDRSVLIRVPGNNNGVPVNIHGFWRYTRLYLSLNRQYLACKVFWEAIFEYAVGCWTRLWPFSFYVFTALWLVLPFIGSIRIGHLSWFLYCHFAWVKTILAQKIYTRAEKKDTSATKEEKKLWPIEKKESYKWIEILKESHSLIPESVKAITVCDRESDFYEFYASAVSSDYKVIVRLVQNRIIQDHQKSLDYMRSMPACGTIETIIPRDTRNGRKSRKAVLEVSFDSITLQKPKRRTEAHIPMAITANAVHVVEKEPPEGVEAIEWFLLTTEAVNNFDDAVRIVEYYVQRWKIERFHYVLKEGCEVEKVQERTFERQSALISLYSMIAIYIMALTYLSRIAPDTDCGAIFDEDEWKLLYRAANKTNQAPETSYSINIAVRYLAKLGGFAGAPSDGAPGTKVIWRGLKVLYTLLEYLEYIESKQPT